MNNTNTGGAAFPMNWVKQEAPNLNVILEQRGMTLRDYFAAKALVALIADPDAEEAEKITGKPFRIAVAHLAYDIADAMLKVREE
jgi:hypothetical protein